MSLKKKNAEMLCLKVNDLLLVCIVQNYDADLPLYIIKIMFSLKINNKLQLKKCVFCCGRFWQAGSLRKD